MRDSGEMKGEQFAHITEPAVQAILGMSHRVPLTPSSMARSLHVTFFPSASRTERVSRFAERVRRILAQSGATILEYRDALRGGRRGKLQENLVIIAPGELTNGDLPVDHVTSLRTATIVGIVDGPCPAHAKPGLQDKLNSVVATLAWNIVQVAIFVDDTSWTVCTMNGAIVELKHDDTFEEHVRSILIPKLAAPVVPPHAADFDLREGQLDLFANGASDFAHDFTESGRSWAETGLMLFHTSLASLSFRNLYYKRIAAAYLDHRSGMSYGFLARQLPVRLRPAMSRAEADAALGPFDWEAEGFRRVKRTLYVAVRVAREMLIVEVPEVWMLTTRSGCDKSNVNVARDVVLLGLSRGKVIFETPSGVSASVDCKPSYDTLTILSHAVGNALVGGILRRLRPDAVFPRMLESQGAALAHWHGLIDPAVLPDGYVVHGGANPPVSCSTLQSAIYALTGKLLALRHGLLSVAEFAGDVHVEPFHGVNVTGSTLTDLAEMVLRIISQGGVTQFSIQTVGSLIRADA